MNKQLILATIALLTCPLSAHADQPDSWYHSSSFPKIIHTPTGSPPEGFTIGKRLTAYNGSIDGSIYKINLRTGDGEILVPAEPGFNVDTDCYKLGMRVDSRTNYLFVAGCFHGNAYVFDADSGALIMEYQLDNSGNSVINDLVITRNAVYFTDFAQPFIYRLPLGWRGEIPDDSSGVVAIPLGGDYVNGDCCAANGIVETPDRSALIVGHSFPPQLYKVDPNTGAATAINITQPLFGFLDGIAMRGNKLYIMTPSNPAPISGIQVVKMESDMLSGSLVGILTDPDLDDVASGALLGSSLYVNNARYSQYPVEDVNYWVTKVKTPFTD